MKEFNCIFNDEYIYFLLHKTKINTCITMILYIKYHLVLNGYSTRNSGYRAATNSNYLWNTKNLHSLRRVRL